VEKEIAEIAKALDTIAMNLKSLAKKAGKSLMPAKADKPAKVVKAKPVSKPGRKSAKTSATAKSATGKRTAAKASPATASIPEQVLKFIQRVRKGISIEAIQEKASLTQQQVNNALSKLIKAGSISRIGRGIYSVAGGTDAAGGGKEKPKAAAKPKVAKAKAKPVAAPKAAKVAPKAPRKPKAAKSKPVVEQPPVEQEPQGQDLSADDEIQPQAEPPVSEAGE
jgi:hypothetical protein